MSNPFELICDRLSNIEEILNKLQAGEIVTTPAPVFENTSVDEKLTIKDLTKRYNWSLSTVHKLKREGKIPYYRLGRKVWFKSSEIDAIAQVSSTGNKKKGKAV